MVDFDSLAGRRSRTVAREPERSVHERDARRPAINTDGVPGELRAILALQRTAGNRQTGLAIARMGQTLSVERPRSDRRVAFERDKAELAQSLGEAARLIDAIGKARLYELRPYLRNRFGQLKQEVAEIAAEHEHLMAEHLAAPTDHGLQGRISRLNRRLNHPDLLPLLRRTMTDAETAYSTDLEALGGWAPAIPDDGSLLERLKAAFEEAGRVNTEAKSQDLPAKLKLSEALEAATDPQARAALKHQLDWQHWRAPFRPVRFLHIRRSIHAASSEERAEAAGSADLLAAAQRYMAPDPTEVPYYQSSVPNDFPEFVASLGVKQTGGVKPFDELKVDKAIRSVLGAWVERPARAGIEIPGHVSILKDRPLEAVKSKYTATLPGGGKVNAFTEDGHIFLGSSAGDPSTIVHEGIHLYASGAVRQMFGSDFDEGVTEYFARMVASKEFSVARDKYEAQHAVATSVIQRLDVDAVARAYFGGSTEPLMARFRILRRDLHGVRRDHQEDWVRFCEHLKEKRYNDATGML
jgi:hypothetical protein